MYQSQPYSKAPSKDSALLDLSCSALLSAEVLCPGNVVVLFILVPFVGCNDGNCTDIKVSESIWQ
jgi:hypothetical protein